MRYVSEFTHEFFGHCGFGYLVGGQPIEYYVSWIWPLEFGYAIVSLPISAPTYAKFLVSAGGIIACLSAAVISNVVVFIMTQKRNIVHGWKAVGLHLLFWYGFWAFMNSAGYLLVGSLLNFGDIKKMSYVLGISRYYFMLPGTIVLISLYYVTSLNVISLFTQGVEVETKWVVFLFWLLLPVVATCFVLNPTIAIQLCTFAIILSLTFLPSLVSLFVFKRYELSGAGTLSEYVVNFPLLSYL